MESVLEAPDGLLLRRPEDSDRPVVAEADAVLRQHAPGMDWQDDRSERLVVTGRGECVGVVAMGETGPAVAGIGYWTAPHARRRGVATAALRTITEWAHANETARVELATDVENILAQRVALSAGFTREGVRRGSGQRDGARYDVVMWGRLADDPPGPIARPLPDLPGGELTDGVVILRPRCLDDVDELFEMFSVPDIAASIVPPGSRSRPELAQLVARTASEWLAGDRADLTIRDAATGELAGDIGLYNERGTGQAMLGYSLVPAWRGRGIATRAVKLVSAWAFDIGLGRLIAGTNPSNIGSQRVLERAGFTRESVQRSRLPGPDGTRLDDVLFSLLPS